ncbi:MAG: hypothetical protein JJE03_01640 [Peptostreptococcaceae bacterium]|nr:hypothetical protein [Peptostreptococcaceae bacterium]
MYHEKRYKVMGFFFAATFLYILVYIYQLGFSTPRVFGALICALISIESFRRSK